jgi:hypothetical protein
MSASLSQTFQYDYNGTGVQVELQNTHRAFTPEELAEAQAIFDAASDFVKKFYTNGTLRPEKTF